MTVPVHIAPVLAGHGAHVDLQLPAGLTVAQIVERAMPGLPDSALTRLRVVGVTDTGMSHVPRAIWATARPRPGVRIVLRMVPGEGALSSILTVVVAVAAVALSAGFAAPLAGALSISTQAASGLITLGTTALGNLAIQSLVPPPDTDQDTPQNRYQVGAIRNELRPDGVVPEIFGTIRYTPPLVTSSWSEIVGDDQVVHYAVIFGGGQVQLSDIWIGDTPISDYDEIETELHTDRPASDTLAITPCQVFEKTVGAELKHPWPVDDAGNRIDGDPVDTPITRFTGKDASGVGLIFVFNAGLVQFDTDDGDEEEHGMRIRIRQRPSVLDDWEEVETITFRGKKNYQFFRQVAWDLPTRGRWQIEVTKMDDPAASNEIETCTWSAIQTLRPEAPVAYAGSVTKLGIRARATAQFNGQIDQLSALCSRIIPDWDAETGTWITRATSNPASIFRAALQGEALAEPEPDSGINLDRLQYWHDFCAAKGLTFNHAFEDDGLSLRDVLTMIAVAGRATPRRTNGQWDVVIDEPQTLVAGHINLRNARDIQTTRSYVKLPHAFRVPFLDATNDYRPDERLVSRPGYDGDITLTELLEMPGKTDPAEVAREATRRFYELMYRPDLHAAMLDHEAMPIERGDLVMFSNPMLAETQAAGRVRRVDGALVMLDDLVTMTEGQDYAIRFTVTGEPDDLGLVDATSVLRLVRNVPGDTRLLTVLGPGLMPQTGSMVHFGPATLDSYPVKVQAIEMGEQFASMLRLIAHAPEIDTLIDAYVAPPWTGRVGADVGLTMPAPPAPLFTGITSALGSSSIGLATVVADADDLDRTVSVSITGSYGGGVLLTGFRIHHRAAAIDPAPAGDWTTVAISSAAGGADITGYTFGETIEITGEAVGLGGAISDPTVTVTHVVGGDDPDLPSSLDEDGMTASGGLGHAVLAVPVPAGATTSLQLYRVPTGGTLDRDTHAVGALVPVSAGITTGLTDGDATRSTLLGAFDAIDWTAGLGWTLDASAADATAGSASALAHPITASDGKTLRIAFTVSGMTGGTLTPQLTGGAVVAGSAITADGRHYATLTASGSTGFELAKDAGFDGSVSDISLYIATTASAPQGSFDYYAEPRAGNIAGSMAGPATTDIS